MKQTFIIIILFICLNAVEAQSVGIGTKTPDSSAIIDASSTTQGFLPPRMNYAQRNSIRNPATGLVIWCTDCDELQVYNGTIWKNMNGKAASVAVAFPNVTICNQVWMVKNLDVRTYSNGDPIPEVTDNAVWGSLTIGAWCWYNNDSATYAALYGRLYNWFAVNDPRGLAPLGWHIPNDEEWNTLVECASGPNIGGGRMKSVTGWDTPNIGATNRIGFSALPGGRRTSTGIFQRIGDFGSWWSSSLYSPGFATSRYLTSYEPIAGLDIFSTKMGLSLRCVKDNF